MKSYKAVITIPSTYSRPNKVKGAAERAVAKKWA